MRVSCALLVGSVLLILSAVVALPLLTAQRPPPALLSGDEDVARRDPHPARSGQGAGERQELLAYVNKKHYDAHRVPPLISTFMIPGGGFTAAMEKKRRQPIKKRGADRAQERARSVAMVAPRTQQRHLPVLSST